MSCTGTRADWQNDGYDLRVVDVCFGILAELVQGHLILKEMGRNDTFGEPADEITLNYCKQYVGPLVDTRADNFVRFAPLDDGSTNVMPFVGRSATEWARRLGGERINAQISPNDNDLAFLLWPDNSPSQPRVSDHRDILTELFRACGTFLGEGRACRRRR